MNKTEFVAFVAENYDLSKKDALLSVDSVFDSVVAALAMGEEVNISGFGKFGITTVAAHTARNPRTGEAVQIEEHDKPTFKYSGTLKTNLR